MAASAGQSGQRDDQPRAKIAKLTTNENMAASVGLSGERDDQPTATGDKPAITSQKIRPLLYGYMADLNKVQRKGKTVYQGFLEANHELLVAAKQIESFPPDVEKTFSKALKTFLISHKNIVSVFNHFILESEANIGPSFWIITEYCDSHLLQFIKNNCGNNPMNPKMASEIMVGCTNGMAFLHSQEPPLVHRNIHPFNILMKKENGIDVVKIADCLISEVFENQKEENSILATTESGYLGMFRKCYTAPEYYPAEIVPQEKAYDTFVLGVVFHALLSYKHESIESSPVLVPQLPECLQLKGTDMSLIGKYINVCAEKGEQPSLFNSNSIGSIVHTMDGSEVHCLLQQLVGSYSEVHKLQNVVRGMLRYKPEERKSLADILKELNRHDCVGRDRDEDEDEDEGFCSRTQSDKESPALHRRYDSLTGEVHQKNQEELEELVDKFVETLGKNAPVYIQHLDASTKFFRINVSIDEGKEQEADEFFSNHCKSFYKFIHQVSQKSKPKYLSGQLPGIKPLVESGSMLICAPPDKAKTIEQGTPLSEIIQPDVDGATTFFTLGCFATDNVSKKHYAITAKHCIDNTVGTSQTQHYSVYSVLKNQNQNVILRVSSERNVNNFIGVYGNINMKDVTGQDVTGLVDIAVCELSDTFRQNEKKFWYVRRAPGLNNDGPIKVTHSLNEDLLECKPMQVRKHGAQTGHTTGVIVRSNKYMRIPGFGFGKNSLVIVSNQQEGVFANEGDSGALVLDNMQKANAWALGLVTQSQENYKEADTDCQSNVTFCVRLKHCLNAMKTIHGIDLELMNQ